MQNTKNATEEAKSMNDFEPQAALVGVLKSYEKRLQRIYDKAYDGEFDGNWDEVAEKKMVFFNQIIKDFKKSREFGQWEIYDLFNDPKIEPIIRAAVEHGIRWTPVLIDPDEPNKVELYGHAGFLFAVLNLLGVLRRIVKRNESIPYHAECWGSVGSWGHSSPIGRGLNAWWRNLEKHRAEKKSTGTIDYPDWFEPMKNAYLTLFQLSRLLEKYIQYEGFEEAYNNLESKMESLLAVMRTVDPFDEWDRDTENEEE